MNRVVRQNIRRVSVRPPAELDEQRWPIHLMILICIGLLGWWTLRSSSFQFGEVPFWENGYIRLGLLGGLLALLFGAVRWLERRVRRRVQLCALFSLAVHLLLLLYLEQNRLLVKALWPVFSKKVPEVHVPIVIPEYGVEPDAKSTRPVEPFDLPQEVALPAPEIEVQPDRSWELALPESSREPLEATAQRPRPLQPSEMLRDFVPQPPVGEFGANIRLRMPERKMDWNLAVTFSSGEVNLPEAKEVERQGPVPTPVVPVRASPRVDSAERQRHPVAESVPPIRTALPVEGPAFREAAEAFPLKRQPSTRPQRSRSLPTLAGRTEVDSQLLASADNPPARREDKVVPTPLPPQRRITPATVPRQSWESFVPSNPRVSSEPLVAELAKAESHSFPTEPAPPARPMRPRPGETLTLPEPSVVGGTGAPSVAHPAEGAAVGSAVPTGAGEQESRVPTPQPVETLPEHGLMALSAIPRRDWRGAQETGAIEPSRFNRPLLGAVAEGWTGEVGGEASITENRGGSAVADGGMSPGTPSFQKRGAVVRAEELASARGPDSRTLVELAQVGGGPPGGDGSGDLPVLPVPETVGGGEPWRATLRQPGARGEATEAAEADLGRAIPGAISGANLRPMALGELFPPRAEAGEGGLEGSASAAIGERGQGLSGAREASGDGRRLRPELARSPGGLPGLKLIDPPQASDAEVYGSLGGDNAAEGGGGALFGSELPVSPAEVSGPVWPSGLGPQLAGGWREHGKGRSEPQQVPGVLNPAVPGTPRGDLFAQVPHSSMLRPAGKLPGGLPALGGAAGPIVRPGFARRQPGQRREFAEKYGGSVATESAVERGLAFLSRYQFPDGRWRFDAVPPGAEPFPELTRYQYRSDTAATALAILAFLGAGHSHLEGKYQSQVARGLEWLLQLQQADGSLFSVETEPTRGPRMYAHGIATIALCEAYGMTQDLLLKTPTEKAVQFILLAQDPKNGGWRYTKHPDRDEWVRESDTSVSGWQLLALRSAQLAGISVPPESFLRASKWLDVASLEQGAKYCYNPFMQPTPESPDPRQASLAMTAEGLLMRLFLGWNRNVPQLHEGAKFLAANLPEMDVRAPQQRDAYYWYYATQVFFHLQGDYWQIWNQRMQQTLLPTQEAEGPFEGSWDPVQPVPDRWAHAGGRIYVTTLHLLMLEVYYRHLPLFEDLILKSEVSRGN